MAEDYISKILESEEKAKHIINSTTEQAKKSHTDTIAREKEALKREEEQYRTNAFSYLAKLQKDADEELQALVLTTDEISNKIKNTLNNHITQMINLVTEYITGKAKM